MINNRKEINNTVCAILRLINIYLQHLKINDVLFTENKTNMMLAIEDEVGVTYNLSNGCLEFIDARNGKFKKNMEMCNTRFNEDKFRKYIIKYFSKKVKGGFSYFKEIHEDIVKFNPDIEYVNELKEVEVEKLLTLTENEKIISYTSVDIRDTKNKGYGINRKDNLLYTTFGNISNRMYGEKYRHLFNRGYSRSQYFNIKDCDWLERLFYKYYLHGGMTTLWTTYKMVKKFLEEGSKWETGKIYFNGLDINNIKDYEPGVRDTFLNHIDGYLPLNRDLETLDPVTVSFAVRSNDYVWWKAF